MKFFSFIRTLISYFFILILILLFTIPFLIIAIIPSRFKFANKVFFFLLDKFYNLIVFFLFVPVQVVGLENIPKAEHMIFVGNHQSAIDGIAMGSILHGNPHIWMILDYYAKIPIIGFIARKVFIPVTQAQSLEASKALFRAVKLAKHHFNIMIFPEGGRYVDGEIHNFFEGFAVIAKKTAMSVVPVYMPNNGKIYPPYSFLIHYHPLKIYIGMPMHLASGESTADFSLRVKDWFVNKSNAIID